MEKKRTQALTRKVLSLEEEVVELKKNNKVTKDLVGNKVQNSKKTEDTSEGDGTSTRVHDQNNDSLKKDNPKESKEKKSKLKNKQRLERMYRNRKNHQKD